VKYFIDWTMFLEAGVQSKANKLFNKIKERVEPDTNLSILEMQQYWKDKTKTSLRARSFVEADSFAEAVYKAIRASSKLSSSCIISSTDAESPEFDGTANPGTITLPGLYSLAFRLQPIEEKHPAGS